MDRKKLACIIAILALVLFSIAYRFPNTPHQNLPDSTDYNYMTTMLTLHGRIPWIENPIYGNFGFEPISTHPTGMIYILSTTTQLTGMSFEPSVLIVNYVTATLICLSGFLVGRKILKNNMAGLLTAYFLTTTVVLLRSNTFTAGPRGLISVFLPLVLLTLISTIDYDIKRILKKKMFIVFFLILIGSLLIHKIIFLFMPVLLAYIFYVMVYPSIKNKIAKPLTKYTVSGKPFRIKLTKMMLFSAVLLFSIMSAIRYGSMFFSRPVFLTRSSLFEGESVFIMTLNFFVRLARNIRLGIVFSGLGFIFLSMKRKNNGEFFTYVGVLAIVPFSIRMAYIYNIWALFMAVFAGYGGYIVGKKIIKKDGKIIKVAMISIILLSIVIIPPFITIREPYLDESNRKIHVEEEEMESAIYLKYNLNKNNGFITSPYFHGQIFTAVSERVSLSLNGHQMYLINNSTLMNNIEFDHIFQDGFDLELYYNRKGRIYEIQHDPLFPNQVFFRTRHHILFERDFAEKDSYYDIVQTYNITTIIINRNLIDTIGEDRSMRMYETLSQEEYILYGNSHFYFFPTKK